MKMLNSSQTLTFVAIALVFAFAVPLKAQNSQRDYLAVHNQARRDVKVPDIKWGGDVAAYAQNYLNRKRDCRPIESGGPYGENLAMSNGDMSGAAAVRSWVREKPNYWYDSNKCRPGTTCKHYTQVVWENSVRLGCAKKKCNNGGTTLVMCCYSPKGNIPGRRPYKK